MLQATSACLPDRPSRDWPVSQEQASRAHSMCDHDTKDHVEGIFKIAALAVSFAMSVLGSDCMTPRPCYHGVVRVRTIKLLLFPCLSSKSHLDRTRGDDHLQSATSRSYR